MKAAGETSKYEPPNIAAFDGSRSTLSSGPKARGRAGPNSIASSAAIAPTSDNALAVVLANFLPALIGASRKRSHSPDPHTPVRKCPQPAPLSSPITSPAPKFDEILHACMIDLATQHGGDFLRIESALQEHDYTPDLIPFVDDAIFANVTQLTAGKIMRLKKLCREWYRRYEKKMGTRKSIFE